MPSIERKNWHLIPVFPKFGSLIDEAGGRCRPLEREEINVSIETGVGMTEIHSGDDGLNVYAEDIGIELHYEKDGVLDNFGLDVFDYCLNASEENYTKMGGEDLDELLVTLYESKKHLSISFNLKKNEVSVLSSGEFSENPDILPTVVSKDFSTPSFVSINFDEFQMLVGCSIEQDEFTFGLLVKKIEDQLTIDTEVYMFSVLRDCNYMTFLKSKTQDRYTRLVKRIFFT